MQISIMKRLATGAPAANRLADEVLDRRSRGCDDTLRLFVSLEKGGSPCRRLHCSHHTSCAIPLEDRVLGRSRLAPEMALLGEHHTVVQAALPELRSGRLHSACGHSHVCAPLTPLASPPSSVVNLHFSAGGDGAGSAQVTHATSRNEGKTTSSGAVLLRSSSLLLPTSL
jgi:hypothetical protein